MPPTAMNPRRLLHFLLALTALLATACAAGRSPASVEAPSMARADVAGMPAQMPPSPAAEAAGAMPASADMASPAAAPAATATAAQPKSAPPAATPQQAKSGDGKSPAPVEAGARPMLIYEAQLGIQVDESKIAATIEAIIDAAESKGGYLVSRSDQAVAVRVPSQELRAALGDIEPLGAVTRRSVSAQDVSDQFHDLEVRLQSLEAVRERLQQFLSRTSNMSEAMTIAAQLDQVAQQIDQVKGQMKMLRTRAAYSLIQVALQAKPRVVVVESPPPPPPPKPPEAKPARMPVEWLRKVGLDSLTRLENQE